jgi:hypothetical protein
MGFQTLFYTFVLLSWLHPGSGVSFDVDVEFDSSSKSVILSNDNYSDKVDSNYDFNGDGFNDLLVSAYQTSAVYLFYGGSSFDFNTTTMTASQGIKFVANNGGLAYACQFAGDVNNDGYDDIIFGDPMRLGIEGIAYLVFGGPTTPSPYSVSDVNPRTVVYTPEDTANRLGYSVAGVGDTNKDHIDDLVICARTFTKRSPSTVIQVGRCYLVYGGANLQSMSMNNLGNGGITITGVSTNQQLGWAVSRAGDINKDGFADFLLSNNDWKYVYLVYGGASLTSFDTTLSTFGSHGVYFQNPAISLGMPFGWALAPAGDFNGDGLDDFMFSATAGSPTVNTIWVIYGKTNLPAFFNVSSPSVMTASSGVRLITYNDFGGNSLAGGQDYNGDGFDDILIGAPYANDHKGSAYLVYGSSNPVENQRVWQLGDGVMQLNSSLTSNVFGAGVTFAINVIGANKKALFVSATSPLIKPKRVYLLHDTPAPTIAPTFAPSVSPTRSPSGVPTVTPTRSPSTTPSFSPTRTPTAIPSWFRRLCPHTFPLLFRPSNQLLLLRYLQQLKVLLFFQVKVPL